MARQGGADCTEYSSASIWIIASVGELEYACKENRLLKLKGFGEKIQAKILEGIAFQSQTRGKLRLSEAFALAAKIGVDPDVVLEIMSGSAASSWMLKDRGPRMLQAEPEVTSAVDIFVKDLGIVLEAGREAKAALPLAAVAHQLFLATSGRGDGAADDSQVIRSYALLNGTA